MNEEQVKKLGHLNAYQIAGLAVATSTIAAVTVLLALRRFLFVPATTAAGPNFGTSTAPRTTPSETPDHFSEELLVPGLTHTGQDIQARDAQAGRSPEGV